MGDIGSELPADSPGGIEISVVGGAESGALRPEAEAAGGLDPALALVSLRWPTLTPEQRLSILEIATASAALEAEPGAMLVARG